MVTFNPIQSDSVGRDGSNIHSIAASVDQNSISSLCSQQEGELKIIKDTTSNNIVGQEPKIIQGGEDTTST